MEKFRKLVLSTIGVALVVFAMMIIFVGCPGQSPDGDNGGDIPTDTISPPIDTIQNSGGGDGGGVDKPKPEK